MSSYKQGLYLNTYIASKPLYTYMNTYIQIEMDTESSGITLTCHNHNIHAKDYTWEYKGDKTKGYTSCPECHGSVKIAD